MDSTIAELFHLAARGDHYTDKELAETVNSSDYWVDAYKKIGTTDRPTIDPRANPFDVNYVHDPNDPDKSLAYSRYFHTIQAKYCTNEPGTQRGVSFEGRAGANVRA